MGLCDLQYMQLGGSSAISIILCIQNISSSVCVQMWEAVSGRNKGVGCHNRVVCLLLSSTLPCQLSSCCLFLRPTGRRGWRTLKCSACQAQPCDEALCPCPHACLCTCRAVAAVLPNGLIRTCKHARGGRTTSTVRCRYVWAQLLLQSVLVCAGDLHV